MMAAKLDDYLIQRRLAPALFGDVLLCQHKPTGDMVAVKRLTLASNKKVRENVALERALYHQLNRVGGHRNLLKLRDEIEFDGYLYLVSDFCARGELYELVSSAADGKLPLPIITKYMRQIASGVLAGVQYDATKADVWSLGVMLFIMLIGAPPVETASSSDARFRLITNKGIRKLIDRWGLTNELPAVAIDLIADMLEVDPEQRISMAEVVSHPFLLRSSSIASPQRIVAPKMQQTRVASPAKQTPQPTASYSSAPSTTMYSTRPESDGIERSGCRLLFHKIHRFFSRRHNKRVMAVRRGSGSSKRAHAKRLANAA
ncbi:Calcium/calmodulin-dependent/calcium-dependent protein kinase [Phytophthora cactorum]|nr:Calcium/calmodulin-dependent/calcium-dependent protein kinase [Phytophthora cactorum]